MDDSNLIVIKDALLELLTKASNKNLSAEDWIDTHEKIDNLILSAEPLITELREWHEILTK